MRTSLGSIPLNLNAPFNHRHHLVAALDQQRAAWAEVVLDVDDDENVIVGEGNRPVHGRGSVAKTSLFNARK